jgi:hypothetical protein
MLHDDDAIEHDAINDGGYDDAFNDDDHRDKLYVVMMHDIVRDKNIKNISPSDLFIKLSIIIMIMIIIITITIIIIIIITIIMIMIIIIFSYTIEASLDLFVHL